LALRDGDRGLIAKCWAGCNPSDVLCELRRRGMIGGRGNYCSIPATAAIRTDHPRGDDNARRIAAARRIWASAKDARGSLVARYLASRGITISLPLSLRWAPACPHPSGIRLPAMVAKVINIDGDLIGLHRTFLQPDGSGKADVEPQKASLGPISGGAVRLAPASERLLIGEGLETSCAAMQATAQPTWAALSTSGLMSLLLPAIAQDIIILADHDANGAGERAARLAAARWLAEGRRVRIAIPPEPGTDFNDVLMGDAYAEVRHVAA
jgi:phage/plasmid primase-like uncharacterized protein